MPYPKKELNSRIKYVMDEDRALINNIAPQDPITNNPFGLSVTRNIINNLAYLELMEQGYSFDEAALPENNGLLKKAGAEVVKRMNTMSQDEFGLYYFDRMSNHLSNLNNYLKEKFTPDMTPADFLKDKNQNVILASYFAVDVAQEVDRMKKYMYEKFPPQPNNPNAPQVKTTADELTALEKTEVAYAAHITPIKNVLDACYVIANNGVNRKGVNQDIRDMGFVRMSAYATVIKTNKDFELTKVNKFDDMIHSMEMDNAGTALDDLNETKMKRRELTEFLAENPDNGTYIVNYMLDPKNMDKIVQFDGGEVVDSISSAELIEAARALAKENSMDKMTMVNSLSKVADNLYGPNEGLTDEQKVSQLMHDGLIIKEDGSKYEQTSLGDADEMVNSVLGDLQSGKDVYVTNKVAGERHSYKMTLNENGVTIADNPAVMLDDERKKRSVDMIKGIDKLIKGTGRTLNDSKEFKDLRKLVGDAVKEAQKTCDAEKMNSIIDKIKEAADNYCFAKLDQAHNARRSKRFEIADKIRNLGKSLDEKERVLNSVAEKMTKELLCQ